MTVSVFHCAIRALGLLLQKLSGLISSPSGAHNTTGRFHVRSTPIFLFITLRKKEFNTLEATKMKIQSIHCLGSRGKTRLSELGEKKKKGEKSDRSHLSVQPSPEYSCNFSAPLR